MALQSQLFQGDPQLEAAAVSDSAHILPGAAGEHVRKIQLALIQLDNATIDADGKSGAHTSAAVLAYKTKRNIINRTYQTQADNIVGKLTMAALDREMLDAESVSAGPIRIRPLFQVPGSGLASPLARPGGLLLGFKLDLDIPITPSGANINLRLNPRSTETLEIVNGKGGIILCSTNSPSGSSNDKTCFLYDPTDASTTIRLNPEPLGIQDPRQFGGQVKLVSEPQILKLDAFAPGDAMIVAANGKSPNTTATVLVRAPKLGVVAGAPPTKLRPADEKEKGRPASRFFSSRDSEPNPTGLNFDRPVNPKRTGRMINLGGEQETPGFEDYSVNVRFSGYSRDFTGNKFLFRPFTEDSDPSVLIPARSASDICSRGTPANAETIAVIKRIAGPNCRLSYAGDTPSAKRLLAAFPTKILEDESDHGNIVVEIP